MGSSISNNKNIDSIINDLGFTKENLTNELQEIYNKYKRLVDDNKKLIDNNTRLVKINKKHITTITTKNTTIIELENIITNYENQVKDYQNKISTLEKHYQQLLTSQNNDLQTNQVVIEKEKKINIELTNKYQLSKKNVSIFKDHNNYLLTVNSKLLKNTNKKTTIPPIDIKNKYRDLMDNLEYHIKQIIGNQEFNVWIPDHYEKKLCEDTIIYIISILSK